MKKTLTLLTFLMLSIGMSFGQIAVSIQSPSSGSTVAAPVAVNASATSSRAISYMAAYLDYKQVYGVRSSTLSTSVSPATGSHSLIVNAWDTSGAVKSQGIQFNVGSATAATTPVVTISSPANGSSVLAPFTLSASATSSKPITYMAVYLDYQKVYGAASNSINAPLNPSVGQHNITVNAWNGTSHAGKKSITITVTAPTPPPPPPPPPPSSANDHYVSPSGSDANAGTQSSPWLTLQHADAVAQPGYVIHVAPGTYNTVNLTLKASGTLLNGACTSRVTWISDQKWGAKIVGGTTGSVWDGSVFIGDGENASVGLCVDFDGFDVTSNNTNVGIGIGMMGIYDRAIGNHVHNLAVSQNTEVNAGGCGICSPSYTVAALKVGHNEAIGNLIGYVGRGVTNPHVHGVYFNTQNAFIADNIIYQSDGYGVILGHAAFGVVANNTVFDNRNGGIDISSQAAMNGGVRIPQSAFVNNIAYHNAQTTGASGCGLGEQWNSVGDIVTPTIADNNLSYGNRVDWCMNLSGGTGSNSQTGNPAFVNYQANGTGNYKLSSGSPALDRGTSVRAPGYDFDGTLRPVGAAYDIGAYEQ